VTEDQIGNYRLLGELGRGGMGIIYKAEQVNLGRFVALKVLYPHLVGDPVTVKRFNHEARATALLNHPNIVQIFDVGVEEDMHYFAMEYVPGKTLQAVLEGQERLPVEETLRILDEVAAALSAAHDVGVIHRDIKPSNILLDDHGTVKVSDFGIAIAAGTGDLTDADHLVGSVRYMSPEHARNEDLDSRSDLYSLGVVMYEMLTGHPPFDGDSPLEVLEQHVGAPVPPLPDDVPVLVQRLTLQCLEKRRVDRPRNVRAFRRALREAVAEVDWQGPALPPLEPTESGFEADYSFRYDRAGVLRSVTDSVSLTLAEHLKQGKGTRGRLARSLREFLSRRVRRRHDSCKMKRLEVMQLEENLQRAEQQLEQAKQECDRAHERYEAADGELHDWQMEGSLRLDRGSRLSKESAAVQEKKLWQQATSYKLQWQNLQDRVRDWYQNVERARRDFEIAVKDVEVLRQRRRREARGSGVAMMNRVRILFAFLVVAGALTFACLDHWVFRPTVAPAPPVRMVYGKFIMTGIMQAARDEHAAALLDSGNVLVAGGIDANRSPLDSAEIFDVRTRKFLPTGKLQEARFNHTMTMLPPGHGVLVVGGEQEYTLPDALASAELYSESEGRFVRASRLKMPRTRHAATLLTDGRVLVSGGGGSSGDTLDSAEVFEPATNSFRRVGRMNTPRKDHTSTLLADGRVLIVGGSQAGNRPVDGVEIYDPKTVSFEAVCLLQQARYEHTTTAIDADRVLVIGGRRGQSDADALDSIEIVDIAKKSSTIVGKLRFPRRVHSAVLLSDGDPKCVLIAGGGVGAPGLTNLCEFFAPGWPETREDGRLNHDRNNQTATLLADGSVLLTGGHGRNTGQPLAVAELYVKVPASPKSLPATRASADTP
jgi:serine/threonine protein kinase